MRTLLRAWLLVLVIFVVGTLMGALAQPPLNSSDTVECDEHYEICDF